MGVKKYKKNGRTSFKLDTWLVYPDGCKKRIKKAGIPTREMALALEKKMKTSAFEGRWFDRPKQNTLTVEEAWANYLPVSKRQNKSWRDDISRAKPLVKHLGPINAARITFGDIENYRRNRLGENTRRGMPPSYATLNRETGLLRTLLNYSVKCGFLNANPIAGLRKLDENNIRQVFVSEAQFNFLLSHAEESLKPIMLVAYDTGMRKQEILSLTHSQLDLKEGIIRLAPADTKTKQPRTIYLTTRVIEELRQLPRSLSGDVFINPRTGRRWEDIRSKFARARKAAKMEHVWFHDLRRSFVTNARRRNIPESVVMRMSGHRTRTVFERYNIVDEGDLRRATERLEEGCKKDLEEMRKEGTEDGH